MSLKDLREKRVLTQAQLADRLYVTPGAVSLWESGKSRPLRKYRVALCQALACTEEELMAETPQA